MHQNPAGVVRASPPIMGGVQAQGHSRPKQHNHRLCLFLLMLHAAAAHCQWSDPVQPSDHPARAWKHLRLSACSKSGCSQSRSEIGCDKGRSPNSMHSSIHTTHKASEMTASVSESCTRPQSPCRCYWPSTSTSTSASETLGAGPAGTSNPDSSTTCCVARLSADTSMPHTGPSTTPMTPNVMRRSGATRVPTMDPSERKTLIKREFQHAHV